MKQTNDFALITHVSLRIAAGQVGRIGCPRRRALHGKPATRPGAAHAIGKPKIRTKSLITPIKKENETTQQLFYLLVYRSVTTFNFYL